MTRAIALAVAVLAGCGPSVIWSGHTLDRHHRVDVIQDAGLQYVAIDGQRRAAYRGIAGRSIAFAEGHLAFAARVGTRWAIVYDGAVGEAWDAIGALVLSRTGQLAYAAERDRGWYVVFAGHAGPRFGSIVAGTLQLGRDEEGISYIGESAGRVTAVVDGKPGPIFDGIGQLVVDGGHHAYAARLALDAYVVVDGVTSPRWAAVQKVELSAGKCAYAASNGNDWRVIEDGVAGPAVDRVLRIVISADGLHHAWVARVADQDVLAVDDIPLVAAPKLRANGIVFRPNSGGLVYVEPVLPRGERVVIAADKGPGVGEGWRGGGPGFSPAMPSEARRMEGPVFDEIGVPLWSADGSHLAYAARRDRDWLIVLDGRELVGGKHVGDPVFSRDGSRFGFVARRGKQSVAVIDGHDHPFDLAFEDTLVFSQDHRRWAIVAGDLGREQMFIAVEGRAQLPLPAIEIYSAAAQGAQGNVLRAWAQVEVDRP